MKFINWKKHVYLFGEKNSPCKFAALIDNPFLFEAMIKLGSSVHSCSVSGLAASLENDNANTGTVEKTSFCTTRMRLAYEKLTIQSIAQILATK